MIQFDEEIKKKMAEQSYEYTPKAWRSFVRHSGMPALGIGAKIAIASTAIVAGAAVIFLATKPALTEESQPAISESETPIFVEQEETAPASTDSIYNIVEEKIEKTKPQPSVAASQARAEKAEEVTVEQPAPSEQHAKAPTTPKKVVKPYYGRPLNILVDTISSNDFPAEKAKSVEEIW